MDYRTILNAQIEKNQDKKGYKSRLAKVAGCQLSYLLQVTKGQSRLSPDQAFELCLFWKFDKEQTEAFMILVLLEKASNLSLKKYYLTKLMEFEQLEAIKKATSDLPSTIARINALIGILAEILSLSHQLGENFPLNRIIAVPNHLIQELEAFIERFSMPSDSTPPDRKS